METQTETPVLTCARVGDAGEVCTNPRAAAGYWCKPCRAKYQQQYTAVQKQMTETRGFAAGVTAAKHFIANEFDCSIRGATINGHEAARLVRDCRGPALPVS
jgi:hypothetical protein